MGKNNVAFITINNIKEDYYRCINYIKIVLEKKSLESIQENENGLIIELKKYLGNNIVPAKLEEPLDNEFISSSLENISCISRDTYENIHFHIRVNFGEEAGIKRYEQLHYLALLLGDYSDLVINKRLSVFLMPTTGVDQYPFYALNSSESDIKKDYLELSSYLRLIIREDLYGVIYSVSHIKKDEKDTIVESLDINRSIITYNYSPLMVFKRINNLSVGIDDAPFQNSVVEDSIIKYVEADKYPTKVNEKEINPELLDNFRLVFTNNIIDKYIDKIIDLKSHYRFGFSKSKNAKLALADYIFETAYKIVRGKIGNIGSKINDYIDAIKCSMGNSNIFCFLVFSYLLVIDPMNIEESIESFANLAKEITTGIAQLIQNSLQHSSSHFCAVSLFVEKSLNGVDSLKIKVSDISCSDICDTFFENIINEKSYVESKILNTNNEKYNICDLKEAYRSIVDFYNQFEKSKEKISHKMFYNEFDLENVEGNALWRKFREIDSSAHIGLALFAQIIKKCDGVFKVNVKDEHKQSFGNDVYSTKDNFYGTDYDITLPIKPISNIEFSAVTKISYSEDIAGNYQSYAEFLDYSMHDASGYIKKEFIDAIFSLQEKFNLVCPIEKFVNQFVWTRFWLNAFCNLEITDRAYCFDLEVIFKGGFIFSNDAYNEMIVKGLINAIDIYAKYIKKKFENKEINILFAFVNLDHKFYKILKNITVSLSLKNFPENVQLFFVCKNKREKMNSYTHLIGSSYGESICNCFNLSIENGSKSYDDTDYYNVVQLMKPFLNFSDNKLKCDSVATKYVFPFTSFIKSNEGMNLFFYDLSRYAEQNIIDGNGYKLPHSHTRLGNKVHIDAFYEMSFVFHRTIVANRVAFEILRMMITDKARVNEIVKSGNILFFGYASYSEAILISITSILRSYRVNKNLPNRYLEYCIYQYNLRTESESDEIEIQMSKEYNCMEDINVVQIVPISSTMTTFEKIWNAFVLDCEKNDRRNPILLCNYTAFWAKASEDSEIDTAKFYTEDKNAENTIICKCFGKLQNPIRVQYIMFGFAKWESPEYCTKCYPQEIINEVPLIETDPTSTVPSQQIYIRKNDLGGLHKVDSSNNERIKDLSGFVHYGHYFRGKNHYQIYVETQKYFTEYSYKIKEWLIKLRIKNKEGSTNYPCLNIIFSPEHNTNVGFSQYVNTFYFNGNAEIVSINEDKQFRTNFVCEYADLKKNIERLWNDYSKLYKNSGRYINKPVRFFFVDDTIISGSTYYKANSFLQSLIPDNYRSIYDSNVFERCFILVNRLSKDSQRSYVSTDDGYHAYCHIDISNMRKQGDSCSCCKFKEEAKSLFRKSATNSLAKYWRGKSINLQEISFDKIQNNSLKNDISYLRVALLHIVKNILKSKSSESKLNTIMNIFDFFVSDETERSFWLAKNTEYTDLYDYWLQLLQVDSNGESIFFNKAKVIENLIKVLTRPFFIYEYDFKSAILKFMILLSEKLINTEFYKFDLDETIRGVVNRVAKLYENKRVKMDFLENVIFDVFSDLQSTYLIRKQTIDNLIDVVPSSCDSVWNSYVANVQRIIQGSSDETRTVRFEHLLLSDIDEYSECLCEEFNNKRITERFKNNFYKELFLLNGHLYFDEIKRICDISSSVKSIGREMEQNEYYIDRMKKIRKMDDFYLEINNNQETNSQLLDGECDLYKLLCQKKDDSASIKIRYEQLLMKIKTMLSCRYGIKDEDLKIAILTSYEGTKKRMSSLQVIEMIYAKSNTIEQARFKYETKKKILDGEENSELKNYGYSVVLDYDNDPYFIVYFDNTLTDDTESELNVGRSVRKICPVYLYVEMHILNKELLWFAMRDILSYRDSILAYLEDDFTSDVLSEYARLTLTEAIFNAERAISHTSMVSDRKELHKLLGTDSKMFFQEHNGESVIGSGKEELTAFTKELALEWAYAKNFTNTSIAKLYNHMLIYINSNVSGIIKDKSIDPMSSRLYIKEKYNDGISVAAEKIIDLIPDNREENSDYMYSLFWQIVDFDVSEELNDALVYSCKYGGEMITYNTEYIKGIIYRIIFDALSNSPDIHNTKFIENISNHYRNKNYSLLLGSQGNNNVLNLLAKHDRKLFEKCKVSFYMERNENSDFHWLVIENTLGIDVKYKMEDIYRKLEDPIDYNDGHISMVASNEYVCKLHGMYDFPIKDMFYIKENKFVTKLPIIRKDI